KVAKLKERISSSQALLLAEYRGLSVQDATELRRSLGQDTRFLVVKNTLMRRAAGEAGVAELERLLEGPTAVAFVAGDPVAAAEPAAPETTAEPEPAVPEEPEAPAQAEGPESPEAQASEQGEE